MSIGDPGRLNQGVSAGVEEVTTRGSGTPKCYMQSYHFRVSSDDISLDNLQRRRSERHVHKQIEI